MKAKTKTNLCAHYDRYWWEYPQMKPDEPLRLDIDSHLKSCELCRDLFEKSVAIHQQLEYQQSLSTSPALLLMIMEKYREKQLTEIRFFSTIKTMAAAAVIVLMIGAGIISGHFIAGKVLPETTVEISDPAQSLTGETFFTEADIFTPGYELLSE